MSFNNNRLVSTKICKRTASLVLTSLILASCATVSVNEKDASVTIEQQRANIVTKNELSNKTKSTLLSTGIDTNECINTFDQCIFQLDESFFKNNPIEQLALFAELHYAKAKEIAEAESCVEPITRPPIDPYFSNAPVPEEEKQRLAFEFKKCRSDHRLHLLESIKYSYAYLFYEQLNKESLEQDGFKVKANHLPTDLDIQTQDVYEVASDALIKQLYKKRFRDELEAEITTYQDSTSLSPSDNHANKKNQVKLLNFKFNPVDLNTKNLNIKDTPPIIADANSITSKKNKTISIDLYMPNEAGYLQDPKKYREGLDELYASHDLTFSGLNTISKREGIGVSYVTLFEDRLNTSIADLLKSNTKKLNAPDPADRIHTTGNLLLTGVISPNGDDLESVLSSNNYAINLYNPHNTQTIDVLGEPYYLSANFSASYGIWLSENNFSNVGYFNLLSKQNALTLPQLYMLEPYDPNKRVIIMMHGLASSPSTWVSVTNDITNDEELRKSYQVWQIFYPTNVPMLENRYQIQKLIETAYEQNDPDKNNIASRHSVLIGHSMGAVISRMMVSNDNLEAKLNGLSQNNKNRQLNNLISKQLDEQNLNNRLHLNQLENVDRAIFISAPFRGTDFADRWFTRTLRKLINLPLSFVKTVGSNLTTIATEGELLANPLGSLYLENGASQLSDKSTFMKLTADLNIANNVVYHSIIATQDSDILRGLNELKISAAPKTQLADKDDSGSDVTPEIMLPSGIQTNENTKVKMASVIPASATGEKNDKKFTDVLETNVTQKLTGDTSDGIVPYTSSHLKGARSETIIPGDHGIHENPKAILTLRKILHEHLKAHPLDK